jgi:hypothetical protein
MIAPFFWCGGTCIDQYLFFLDRITWYSGNVILGHPITRIAFWEFSSAILFSNVAFFYGPTTQAKFTSLLANVPLDVVWAHIHSRASPTIGAWLLDCPSTLSFWLSFVQFLIAFHIRLSIPHPTIPHLSHCRCGHTINDLGIHLLCCLCESGRIITHDMFQNTVATITS